MNDFVQECRREWRRLGVPDPVADEMAAELAADLDEAEAEGVSAEEVLGSGAFDPRSFAAAWAAERGVIRRRQPTAHGLARRFAMPAAIGVFALIAIVGAVVVILASPSATRQLTLEPASVPPPSARMVRTVWVRPLLARDARIVAVDTDDSGVDTRTVGSVLLVVGLAGLVPMAMFRSWVGAGRWSRRRVGDRPSGPA